MTAIEQKLQDLVNQFEELERMEIESNKLQSEHDLELSRLYHVIEGTTLSHVSQSHNLMKELQELLIKRRSNKFDNALIKGATALLKTNIQSLKEKIETKKTKKTNYFVEIKEFAKNQ
jgi:hypothetical protein